MKKFSSGQNLIEVLLALGIFAVVAAGSAVLVFRYFETQNRAQVLDRVRAIAQETQEALQSIAANDWASLVDGTYGLSTSSGRWALSVGPNLIDNTFTRSLSVSSVQRDAGCNIVSSGGTDDPDTKQIGVSFSWDQSGSSTIQNFTNYVTRWHAPTNCVVEEDAADFHFDITDARIDSTKKSLVGIEMYNNGTDTITLDKMTVTWTKPGNITYIKIEDQNYWHSTNGVGAPQGPQPSGTELDLVNFAMSPSAEDYEIDTFRFDEKVDGSTFTITATLTDGSSVTVTSTPPFVP